MPSDLKLGKLHKVLQALFGWQDCHLHDFEQRGVIYQDPRQNDEDWDRDVLDYTRVRLGQLLSKVGQRLTYHYDYGDSWTVRLKVSAVGQDEQPPEVLDGQRAGPPEDCGGISGLEHLNRVLAHPKDPEHLELRTWVGRNYQPEVFPLEKVRSKVRRLVASKPATRPAMQAPAPWALDFEPQAPRLEEYELKNLKPRNLMVAALLERGQPLALEELEARIRASGYPLPQGVDTLRRAWRKDSLLRLRQDGRLEVDREHPEFWRHEFHLEQALRPPDGLGQEPLDWSELERLPKNRYLPLTRAQWLVAALDALGGSAGLALVAERLAGLDQHFKPDPLLHHAKVPVSGTRDTLSLDRESPWTRDARQAVREVLRTVRSPEELKSEYAQEERRLMGVPWYLVVWERGTAVIRELQSGTTRKLAGAELAAFLAQAQVVYSQDVFALYEQSGVLAHPETRRFDLMPATVHPIGGERQREEGTTFEDIVRATLGPCYPAQADLGARLPYHACVLAYGQLHGSVWGPTGALDVWWDLAQSGQLRDRLTAALEGGKPVLLSVRPRDPLQPELDLRPFRVGRLGEASVWGTFEAGQKEVLVPLREIHRCDCEFDLPRRPFSSLAYRLRPSRLLQRGNP